MCKPVASVFASGEVSLHKGGDGAAKAWKLSAKERRN